MGLFRKKGNSENDNLLRILFTSDVHGSDIVMKKFLNAGIMYKVNALIIGGDLAGKTLIPIVDLGNGKYEVEKKEIGKEGLNEAIKSIRDRGGYYTIVDKKGLDELREDKKKLDEAFKTAISDVLRSWCKIVEEKLKEVNIPLYVNLGNDDPEYMFDVIDECEKMRRTEGNVINIGDHEMISYGYVNPTPWNTPREMDEEKLYEELKKQISKLTDVSTSIFNLHPPPYNTNLDNAPLLDENLKPVIRGGEIVMVHVGSKAVRKVIEEYQPLVGLHGHIHESRGFDKIGRTVILNPGSEFGEGILHAALIILEKNKIKAHQFIIG
ncbi:metallophosphoesterase [Acidianus sp. RZ1]|uniref:metallophosphoesterase family protein n=1 Tax=Acidianus sp. RZ1 TaxID=1540082 RepID=UPI00149141CF|nr:hypothetical protein [Acidianus sp. RZ1]